MWQGLIQPDQQVVEKMSPAFKQLVAVCCGIGDVGVLPPFPPNAQYMRTPGRFVRPLSAMDLKPHLDKASVLEKFDLHAERNLGLLQPAEYADMVKKLVPGGEVYPLKPLPPTKKISKDDVNSYGWKWGDKVKVKMYGWCNQWYRVLAVETENEHGEWQDIWAVAEKEIPDDIDPEDHQQMFHGAEDLQELLMARETVTEAMRDSRKILLALIRLQKHS